MDSTYAPCLCFKFPRLSMLLCMIPAGYFRSQNNAHNTTQSGIALPIPFLSSEQDHRLLCPCLSDLLSYGWNNDRATTTLADFVPLAVAQCDPHHTPPTSITKSTSSLRLVFLVSGRVIRYISTDHRTVPHQDLVHIGTTPDSMIHCSIS